MAERRTEASIPKYEYDRELVANVRPPDWRNPEPAAIYNLVVIGAGTAGLITAGAAAVLGARVALVARDRMGGDCLNTGCVPSKALLRSARLYSDLGNARAFTGFYPTQAEAIRMAADAYLRTRLTPLLKGLSTIWLAGLRRLA